MDSNIQQLLPKGVTFIVLPFGFYLANSGLKKAKGENHGFDSWLSLHLLFFFSYGVDVIRDYAHTYT